MASTVRPPRATLAPVHTPDRGSRSVKISTAPRPMAPMPNRTAEAVATRLAAALSAAERARARTVDQTAPGPLVFDGEHDQRQQDHEQAGSGRHQQHHADGEDDGAHDGEGDAAEQSDQVHCASHARARPGKRRPPHCPALPISSPGSSWPLAGQHHDPGKPAAVQAPCRCRGGHVESPGRPLTPDPWSVAMSRGERPGARAFGGRGRESHEVGHADQPQYLPLAGADAAPGLVAIQAR